MDKRAWLLMAVLAAGCGGSDATTSGGSMTGAPSGQPGADVNPVGKWVTPEGAGVLALNMDGTSYTFASLGALADGSYGLMSETGHYYVSGGKIHGTPTETTCPAYSNAGAWSVAYRLDPGSLTLTTDSMVLIFQPNTSQPSAAVLRKGCWHDGIFTASP